MYLVLFTEVAVLACVHKDSCCLNKLSDDLPVRGKHAWIMELICKLLTPPSL